MYWLENSLALEHTVFLYSLHKALCVCVHKRPCHTSSSKKHTLKPVYWAVMDS